MSEKVTIKIQIAERIWKLIAHLQSQNNNDDLVQKELDELLPQIEKIYQKRFNYDIIKEYKIGPNTYLHDAALHNADLRNADLRNAHFFNARLTSAQLREANLSNADIVNSSFFCANLRGANLEGATIRTVYKSLEHFDKAVKGGEDFIKTSQVIATFQGANLEGANLKNIKLYAVNLDQADLTNADLTGAELKNVSFKGAILVGVKTDDPQLQKLVAEQV